MNCRNKSDCTSMKCGKVGSFMKCLTDGCVCTLPKYSRNIITLETQMWIVCGIVLFILFLLHMQPKDTYFSANAVEKSFIPSSKFAGYKKGYVFKKDKLGIGYYKDIIT